MNDLSSIVRVSQRDRTCFSYPDLCAMTWARHSTWRRALRDTTLTSRPERAVSGKCRQRQIPCRWPVPRIAGKALPRSLISGHKQPCEAAVSPHLYFLCRAYCLRINDAGSEPPLASPPLHAPLEREQTTRHYARETTFIGTELELVHPCQCSRIAMISTVRKSEATPPSLGQ
jgi:hypothetical protein